MSNFKIDTTLPLEEGLELYKARLAGAYQTISQKGFPVPAVPVMQTQQGSVPYQGELPVDITSLNDNQLGQYLGLLSEWNAYVQYQLAEADANLTHAKAALELTEAKLRILYRNDEEGKKRTTQEKDDHVKNDKRFAEANSLVIYWETYWRFTKAIAWNAENAFSTISRRITQRGQDIERSRREGGTTGHTNIAPTGPLFGHQGYRPGR